MEMTEEESQAVDEVVDKVARFVLAPALLTCYLYMGFSVLHCAVPGMVKAVLVFVLVRQIVIAVRRAYFPDYCPGCCYCDSEDEDDEFEDDDGGEGETGHAC